MCQFTTPDFDVSAHISGAECLLNISQLPRQYRAFEIDHALDWWHTGGCGGKQIAPKTLMICWRTSQTKSEWKIDYTIDYKFCIYLFKGHILGRHVSQSIVHCSDGLGQTPPHVSTSWHHTYSCLPLTMTDTLPLVPRGEQCAAQHREATEPQIAALRRWIPNSPSPDSTLLAVNHTAWNEVKWRYLDNTGAPLLFLLTALTASIPRWEAEQFLEMVINK